MIAKIFKVTTGAIVGGCLVSENFREKVDYDLIRPIRNYQMTLAGYEHFRMPEDFAIFRREMAKGIKNFVLIRNDDAE